MSPFAHRRWEKTGLAVQCTVDVRGTRLLVRFRAAVVVGGIYALVELLGIRSSRPTSPFKKLHEPV